MAAVGYPLGWVTLPAFKVGKGSKAEQEADALLERQTLGPVKGSFVGIILGLIVGLLLGTVIVMFWLSLALSPLTPDSWREGIHTSFFSASLPAWPTLGILGWTTAVFVAGGIVLGLCGKVYGG